VKTELRSTNVHVIGKFDSLGDIDVIDGEEVMVKPVLKPGELHTYSSGCLLSSPYGAMKDILI
jgi:uncharacterized protein affecting Mg2+/Co2+ transport